MVEGADATVTLPVTLMDASSLAADVYKRQGVYGIACRFIAVQRNNPAGPGAIIAVIPVTGKIAVAKDGADSGVLGRRYRIPQVVKDGAGGQQVKVCLLYTSKGAGDGVILQAKRRLIPENRRLQLAAGKKMPTQAAAGQGLGHAVTQA